MRDGRLHADPDETIGVVHRLPGVNGELAASVVGVSVIPNIQLRAVIREELHDGGTSFVRGPVEGDTTGVGLRIRILTQVQQQLHGFQCVLLRPFVGNPLDPADSSSDLQRRHPQGRRDFRVRAAGQQKFHQGDVAGLGGAQERRRAVFIEPLVREDRSSFRAVLHPRVHVGALVQKELDELQMVHVALADRIIPGLDVTVVGREIERDPSAFVGEVRIGAVVKQIRSELVVPILRRDKQRAPAVPRDLVHVRSGGQQNLDRLEIV